MLFAIIAISEDTLPNCANLKRRMLLTYWWVLPLELWPRAVHKFAFIWFSFLGQSREIVFHRCCACKFGSRRYQRKLKDQLVHVLIDTGASDNFINKRVADELQIEGRGPAEQISLATTKAEARIHGKAVIDINICGKVYHQVQLRLMSDLRADGILDQKFLRRHSEITLHYGRSDHPLRILLEPQSALNVSAANLTPPRIFEFLATDCKPFAIKSRRYNREDSDFSKSEVIYVADTLWSAHILKKTPICWESTMQNDPLSL